MRPPIGAAWSGSAVPATRPTQGPATARRYSPTISHPSTPSAANSLPPFARWPAFPASDYYDGSATPRPAEPTTNRPAADLEGRPAGPARDVSHVHRTPVDGVGAQLCPCGIATSTPQTFLVASLPATSPGTGVARPITITIGWACTALRPTSARLEPVYLLRGFYTLVPHVHLSVSLGRPKSSGSTDSSCRCQGC